ncbi:hypothetical protein [Parafrankia elaeagni]|uniref:hypothetical protein n=1 Tax=Parafrankia elaeagni TaxID=222534 RepID=UPI00039B4C83|nr:hypothetical protein [Parafrankia elaeagni]
MKFRTLGVALVAGGGLALAALPASPAAAFDDNFVAYPPVGCSGMSGEGSVSKSLLLVGEATIFGGCGFYPGSTVEIQIGGVVQEIASVDDAGRFSVPVIPTAVGTQTLAAVGEAGAPDTTGTAQDTSLFEGGDWFADGTGEEGDWFADEAGEEGGLVDEAIDEAVPVMPEAPVVPVAPEVPDSDATLVDPPLPVVGGPAVDVPATGVLPADGATDPAPEVPGRLAGVITQAQGPFGPRVVTATITVIGIGQGGITGLPIDPGLIASWIGDWGNWDDKHDKDRDGRDGSCFGDGLDKDKDNFDEDKDGVDKDGVDTVKDDEFGEQQGLAAPVPTALADGDDRFDDKDDKDDWFGDKDSDKDRDRDGDCIIAGGVVGVGVGGAGVGGAGAGTGAGALPFTGVETGAMASIAIALLGGGVLLRVAARRRRLAGRAQG